MKIINLTTQFNQFQIHDYFKNPENVVNYKYYNLENTQTMKIPNKKSSLSLFHIKACSLSKNFEDIEYLLKTTNTNFDRDHNTISEITILRNTKIVKRINIPNFFVSLLHLNQQLEELYHTLQTI